MTGLETHPVEIRGMRWMMGILLTLVSIGTLYCRRMSYQQETLYLHTRFHSLSEESLESCDSSRRPTEDLRTSSHRRLLNVSCAYPFRRSLIETCLMVKASSSMMWQFVASD